MEGPKYEEVKVNYLVSDRASLQNRAMQQPEPQSIREFLNFQSFLVEIFLKDPISLPP